MQLKHLTIGNVAGKTNVTVETIRYYERIGLVEVPTRTSGGYRSYDQAHVKRLNFIRRSRDLGFSIEQIRTLLDLSNIDQNSCDAIDAVAREHLHEVDLKIAALRSLREELNRMVDQCACGTVSECRIIESLNIGNASMPENDLRA